jgi:hypothetical protein
VNFPTEQIEELEKHYEGVRRIEEGGLTYFYIPALILPDGCEPKVVEAMLCPVQRDGYTSRLFLSEIVKTPFARNWNANGVRIVERQWYAFSYNDIRGMTLLQMLAAHLRGMKENR